MGRCSIHSGAPTFKFGFGGRGKRFFFPFWSCYVFLPCSQVLNVFPKGVLNSTGFQTYMFCPKSSPSHLYNWGVLCKGYYSLGEKLWRTLLQRGISCSQWEGRIMLSRCLGFFPRCLGFFPFKFGGLGWWEVFFSSCIWCGEWTMSTWTMDFPYKFYWEGRGRRICFPFSQWEDPRCLAFISFKFWGQEGFFSIFPCFPMCSHNVHSKFLMGSQYVLQVHNVFLNMFSI